MNYDLTLWDIVEIARRRWRWIALGTIGTIVLAILFSVLVSPKYRSEALLLVRLGRENLGVEPIAGMADKSGVNMVDTRENEVNSMANVLKSRELAEHMIDEITPQIVLSNEDGFVDRLLRGVAGPIFPYYRLDARSQAVYELQNKLKIKALDKSSVIRVSYDAKDPRQAQQIVNSAVETYLALHSQIHRTSGSLSFLESELKATQENLLAKENELKQLKSETGLIAPTEQRAALVGRISKLKSDLMEVTASQNALQKELETLEQTLVDLPETEVATQVTGAGNSAVDSIRAKVFDLQTQLNELLAKYTEEHIRVKQLRQAIASAQSILEEEERNRRQTTQGRSRSYDETNLLIIRKRAERDALDQKSASLESLISLEEKKLDEWNSVELKIGQMTREIDILKNNYQEYSADVERARIDTELELKSMTNVSVAQPASFNPLPVFPIVPLNVALGGVLGIFLGGLLAIVAEFRAARTRVRPISPATQPRSEIPEFEFATTQQEPEIPVTVRHPR
jgi:uncharacterized protein involved in exopolysaccharide biosynthesis